MQGFAEGIREKVIDTRKAAAFILAESRHLERLIGDLLDLARLRAGRFDVRPRRRPRSHRAGCGRPVQRSRRVADHTRRRTRRSESLAFADPDRVLQITSNLIENALRASPPGSSVSVETGPGRVTVNDCGPGLHPDELQEAFDRYILHDRHKQGGGKTGAAGLGLALVKELTETMGGSVTVASGAGGGSAFTVRLPVSDADALRGDQGADGGGA